MEQLADGARPIAGGTDLVVGVRQGKAPLPRHLVTIDRIGELRTIESSPEGLRIAAGVTHRQLMSDPLIGRDYSALADAAALIGSPATRNVGTLGGNVMNGSPAMDTGAPLVVLGATVELRSVTGTRRIEPLDLWTAPGTTTASTRELCTVCVLPRPSARTGSAYVRLEYRRAMEVAVAGAAARVSLDEAGLVADLAVALTAVAPTIMAVVGVDELVHPLQQVLIDTGGVQCGFCTPGMLISAQALLAPDSDLDEEQVRIGLSGNLCRCTGYTSIAAAVLRAADRRATPQAGQPD